MQEKIEKVSERIDIRMPKSLLREIEKYQSFEDISNRSTAMFELVRIGLHSVKSAENMNIEVMRGNSQRIDIRVPIGLLERIEEYQDSKKLKTRAKAMKELIVIGLTQTIGYEVSAK